MYVRGSGFPAVNAWACCSLLVRRDSSAESRSNAFLSCVVIITNQNLLLSGIWHVLDFLRWPCRCLACRLGAGSRPKEQWTAVEPSPPLARSPEDEEALTLLKKVRLWQVGVRNERVGIESNVASG